MKKFKNLKRHKAFKSGEMQDKVNENVLVVGDGELFKVSKVVDVPKKLVNALVKKVKEETGKNPKIFWNDVAIADEIVKHIISTYLNSDTIPASILMGDTALSGEMGEEEEMEDFEEEGMEEESEESEEMEEESDDDDDMEEDDDNDDNEDSIPSDLELEEGDGEEESEEEVPSLDDDNDEE